MATVEAAKFALLADHERLALGVLALCGEPVDWSDLQVILGHGQRHYFGAPTKRIDLHQGIFTRLAQQRLIGFDSKKKMSCEREVAAQALAYLVKSTHLPDVAEGVMQGLPALSYSGPKRQRMFRDFRLAVWLDDGELLT